MKGDTQWQGNRVSWLNIEGFLFSLQADGRATRTHQYYRKLLKHFLQYVDNEGWPDRSDFIDVNKLRQFLSWVGSRTFKHDAGNRDHLVRKAKSSPAWPCYKALRRLFNWLVEEGLIESSPVSTFPFKTSKEVFSFITVGNSFNTISKNSCERHDITS